MKAQFIHENKGGIPWSGKDPTKAPIIGKLLTRRTSLGDGQTMKPEILQVVEINEPYYIIDKWYKSGVPQVIHDDMVSFYIPIEKYKDAELEQNFNEAVKKSEDEWANDQLDQYQEGRDRVYGREVPEAQKEVSQAVARMAHAVSSLEDYLWNSGNDADRDNWRKYMQRFEGKYSDWTELPLDDLELAYHEVQVMVGNITRRN